MPHETPHPNVTGVVTGHFHEGPAYANWRARGTRDFLLLFTLSGAGRIGHSAGELLARPGDLALFRPGALQDYGTSRNAAGWELLWTHFLPHPHWLPILAAWPEIVPGVTLLSTGSRDTGLFVPVRDALLSMHSRALSGLARREDFARCSLEEALLWADTLVTTSGASPRRDARVARAAEILLGRMVQPLDLGAIADTVGLSASRLGHLFREHMGMTPQQFLESARMERARRLLTLTDRTVSAIAADVGYVNPFYFTLRFKRQMGQSPSEWRRGQRSPLEGLSCYNLSDASDQPQRQTEEEGKRRQLAPIPTYQGG